MTDYRDHLQLSRRVFLKSGTLVLAAAGVNPLHLYAQDPAARLSFGLVTDLHYADKVAAGTRHYRETLAKLSEAAVQFEKDQPAFLVELGDLIDAADSVEVEQKYLQTINEKFSAICKDRHYVLGNHCVDTLKKEEFLGQVEQENSYYSFDRGGIHFVVLDACFRADGTPYQRRNFTWTDANIPAEEIEWLKSDLKANDKPVIVFAHQRLDVTKDHSVKNNSAIRAVLEDCGKVLAVFQGHSHQNELQEIGGIHYCTLVAMVEGSGEQNNGYSLIQVDSTGSILLSGFRNQQSRSFTRHS